MTKISPTPETVKTMRENVQAHYGIGITEAQDWCSEKVLRSRRNWQQWELGERKMDAALWKLFRIEAVTNGVHI